MLMNRSMMIQSHFFKVILMMAPVYKNAGGGKTSVWLGQGSLTGVHVPPGGA